MNLKGTGRGLIEELSRYILELLRKSMKNLSQVGRYPGRDSNRHSYCLFSSFLLDPHDCALSLNGLKPSSDDTVFVYRVACAAAYTCCRALLFLTNQPTNHN
jgi:hypothetical protein